LLTLLVPFLVFSQVAAGTLSGTVVSESGSRILNAHLSIRNTGNGKTVFTNGKEDGSYSVPNLVYRIVATTGPTFASRNQSAGDSSFGTVPGHNAAGVKVPGVTAFTGGLGTITEFHFHWTSIQAYDDISWVRGNHALRFGLGIERIRDNKLGRNTLTGPGLLNLSVVKNNYVKRVSDAFNVQFRTEFFNLLNRANFAPPLDNRNIFDATGAAIANAGLITSTQTPSRQIQLALKVIW